jgi:TRAP-type uncharacterized transport system fused permease subunit
MFFYSPQLLLIGEPWRIGLAFVTGVFGVYFLAAAVQGWFVTSMSAIPRLFMLIAAVTLIYGTVHTDLIGAAIVAALFFYQRAQLRGREADERTAAERTEAETQTR